MSAVRKSAFSIDETRPYREVSFSEWLVGPHIEDGWVGEINLTLTHAKPQSCLYPQGSITTTYPSSSQTLLASFPLFYEGGTMVKNPSHLLK